MNFEICKKCKLNSFNYFYRLIPNGFNFSLKSIENDCTIYFDNSVLYHFIEKYRLYNKEKAFIERYFFESDKNAEPDKNICPYYLEHQLNKWNKS
jgi:hypothetical protein